MAELELKYGLAFGDLYRREGLAKVDDAFLKHLGEADAPLRERLVAARGNASAVAGKDESTLLIDLAPHLEDFIGALFGIGRELRELQARHDVLAPIHTVKRLFVQRRATKGVTPEQAAAIDGSALAAELGNRFGEPLTERSYAHHVAQWLDDESANAANLELAARYAAWATLSPAGRAAHHAGVLFKQPHKLDVLNLVHVEKRAVAGITVDRYAPERWRQRDGFKLTDPGTDLLGALDNANYCIWCHEQGKDSCSHGLKDKKTDAFQKSLFGVTLAGCPLEEKVSEMNMTKARGHTVGALAIAVVDN
ncbi:MAG: pyridine nucleotide-disulfide oxidoreductase, partial [Stellaceae bacterium]